MSASPTICPLCGHRFDAAAGSCKPSCPLASGCSALCCPRCSYSFPREDRGLAGLIQRTLVRLSARKGAP
jgi:hypothetical protein